MTIRALFAFLPFFLGACGGDDSPSGPDADSDTDVDSDVDSDTDADTDSDTGTANCDGDDDCDDGVDCNGAERCDADLGCVAGEIDPAQDLDGDGFSTNDGDCDECEPRSSPGRFEVLDGDGAGIDDDCDGEIDEAPAPCDDDIALDSTDPMNAAKALGLCDAASGEGQGLVDARFVRANGEPLADPLETVGILDTFGPNVPPEQGARLLGLSTGHARTPGQADACGSQTCTELGPGVAPPGFPGDVPGCTPASAINDDVGLEVDFRVPTNATGYRFRYDFYTFEYPEWVCGTFNDQFIVLASPAPVGVLDGNVAYDAEGNPVTVNSSMQVCSGCPLGNAELAGTGFDTWGDAGATGWVDVVAPATPGDLVTLRFTIFDVGDTNIDSTVLLDAFQWVTE